MLFSLSYGLAVREFAIIFQGLLELSRHTAIYPPPQETFRYGDKGTLNMNLDLVAFEVTKTSRPAFRRLRFGERIPEGGVVKRSFSAETRNVCLAEEDAKTDADKNMVKPRDWAVMGHPTCFQQSWVWQAMNPLIRSDVCGEVRAYFIGGKLDRILWWPMVDTGDISAELVGAMVPLEWMA